MPTRVFALLVAVSAVAAKAQEQDLSGLSPAIGGSEAPAAAPQVAAALPGSKCTTSGDCDKGLVCSRYRPRADEKAVKSMRVCQAPRLIERESGWSADRFKYLDTIPEGFHLVSERSVELIGAGAGLFLTAYLVPAVWGLALPDGRSEPRSLIPLAGVVYLIARLGIRQAGSFELSPGILYVFGPSVQVAGLVMLVVGLVSPRRWLERDVVKPSVTLVPGAAGAPVGASLMGRF